jgi:hypothetical protein
LEREFKIEVSSHSCRKCGRSFAAGEEYFSAVTETAEEDRLQRQDFCPACWSPESIAAFSFWKARVPEPAASTGHGPRLIDMGRLMQLFEHLAEAPDVEAQRFRYVLALVLMRKRRLKVVESRRLSGGRGEELTLRETGGQRRHVVSCPSITEEEIRSVAGRLRDILDMPERWDQIAPPDRTVGAVPVSGLTETGTAPLESRGTVPFSERQEKGTAPDDPAAEAPQTDA